MTPRAAAYRALRAAYAEYRTAVAAHLHACMRGDADAVLAAAVDGDWLAARVADLHEEAMAAPEARTPAELIERAACAAEAEALAKELDALATAVTAQRNRIAREITELPNAQPTNTAYQAAPAPVLLDARG